jgi:LCP family protein required for cell wall assembly
MDCLEARGLIDAGLRQSDGARHGDLARHLRSCPGCRAHQAAADARLLGEMLAADAMLSSLLAEPPPPSPARVAPAEPRPPRRQSRPRWLRYGIVGALAVVALWLGLMAGRLAHAAYAISQNLAAMRIQPTPALILPRSTAAAAPAAAPVAAPTLAALPSPPPTAAPAGQPALIPSDPPAPPATATPGPAYQPSATPIRLPVLGGQPLPTLMATAPVALPSGKAVNILMLGSDRRPGEGWSTRSDAVMVVRLDPARQRVALLSLPRDLIVPIPGYGQARVNAATVYGEADGSGGGAELARQTVGQFLGLPIDHVLRLDFNAFTAAVDAIGGVDILVEEELYDPAYPTMDYGYMEAYFAPGLQHMDGETALIYSRIRHTDSNYARNRRQQQVILAVIDKVQQSNLLGQVELISDLTAALRDDIQTDLSLEQMVGLAWQFRGLAAQSVERYALDENMVSEGVLADDPYATFALPGAVEQLVTEFLGG